MQDCCFLLKHLSSFPQSLLDEPNPNSPANSQAAQLYQENKREYEKRVSAIVEQSWRDSWPDSPDSCSLHCKAVCAASFSGVPLNFWAPPTFLILSFYALYLQIPFIECFFFFFFFLFFSYLPGGIYFFYTAPFFQSIRGNVLNLALMFCQIWTCGPLPKNSGVF